MFRIEKANTPFKPDIEEVAQVSSYVDTSKPDQRIAEGPSRQQGLKRGP